MTGQLKLNRIRLWHLAAWGVCIALVVAIDQVTKILVETNLALGQTGWELGFIAIQRSVNTGIAWGLFSGNSTIFAFIVPIVVVLISGYYLYFLKKFAPTILITIGFGLVIGGSIGNLVDRLRQDGVTDFINPSFWASFNVADAAISCGLVIIVLKILFTRSSDTPNSEKQTPSEVVKDRDTE